MDFFMLKNKIRNGHGTRVAVIIFTGGFHHLDEDKKICRGKGQGQLRQNEVS